MANVLNEFLHGVSKGFQDAAFASFSRRRSTVREDISQSFTTSDAEASRPSGGGQVVPAQEYLDLLNSDDGAADAAPSAALAEISEGPARKPVKGVAPRRK
jgi:hypothetical protein